MKKLILIILLILSSTSSFAFPKDKLGIIYSYDCKKCDNMYLKEECKKHKGSCFKLHLLEDPKILLEEFNKNEPRALRNYSKKKNIYFISGKIKSLDSGVFDDDFIINLKDGTTIYISKTDEEKYFELNKGDIVSVYADSPSMTFGELDFKNGHIISNRVYQNIREILKKY